MNEEENSRAGFPRSGDNEYRDLLSAQEGSGERHGIIHVVERVRMLIEAETAALKQFDGFDMEGWNQRKAQAMIDMIRAARTETTPSPLLHSKLRSLLVVLEENRKTIDQRCRAMSEITQAVMSGIARSDSDGTYSRRRLKPAGLD